MFRWRTLGPLAAVVLALAVAQWPMSVAAQQDEDQPGQADTPRTDADQPGPPDADKSEPPSAGQQEPPGGDREEPGREPEPPTRREPSQQLRTRRAALSDDEIEDALRFGRRDRGRNQGLILRDTGRAWSNALNALADEPTEGTGFWLEIYTPMSWLAQLSSDAAREYRDISRRDVDREDLAAVLRVVVHPDMPDRVSRRGMRLSASVEHVVIRPRGDRGAPALHPISTRDFDETAVGRRGREATFYGIQAVFDLDAVKQVIEVSRNGEFDVIVIGTRDREKTFGVKKKHFDRLPGLRHF